MLSINGRSHVIHYVLTLQIFSAAKKLCFWQKSKKVLNWLNSANWAKLHKGHVKESQDEVTSRGHVDGVAYKGAYKLPNVICIYQWAEFNNADFSRVKCRCQLIVKLKANKYYQELFFFLSSYINFLNLLNCQRPLWLAPGPWPVLDF